MPGPAPTALREVVGGDANNGGNSMVKIIMYL